MYAAETEADTTSGKVGFTSGELFSTTRRLVKNTSPLCPPRSSTICTQTWLCPHGQRHGLPLESCFMPVGQLLQESASLKY